MVKHRLDQVVTLFYILFIRCNCFFFYLDFLPLGGFLCDSKYAWLAKGAVLQIISTTSHSKISEWIFGNILKDPTIQITSVAEIARKGGGMPLLAVGLQSNLIGGFICIFDVALSKVIRTIDVKNNVRIVTIVIKLVCL